MTKPGRIRHPRSGWDGAAFRRARLAVGASSLVVCQHLGVARSTLLAWEAGVRHPPPRLRPALASMRRKWERQLERDGRP